MSEDHTSESPSPLSRLHTAGTEQGTTAGAARIWVRRLKRAIRDPREVPRALRRRLAGMDEQGPLPLPESPSDTSLPGPQSHRFAYPHLRIAVLGRPMDLNRIAPTVDLSDESTESIDGDFDLVLVASDGTEPSSRGEAMVRVFKDRQIPVVAWVSSTTQLPPTGLADFLVTPDPRLAHGAGWGQPVLVAPSFDPLLHNPTGWPRAPTSDLIVVDQQPLAVSVRKELEMAGYRLFSAQRLADDAPNGVPDWSSLKGSVAAYVGGDISDPVALQRVVELAAVGVPILSPPSSVLDDILDGHYQALANDALEGAIEAVSAEGRREKLSIAARRHVILSHTHLQLFEKLLRLVHIPTTPRQVVSVLLATRRPESLSHALFSFHRQTWPHKELILILHGIDRFDRAQLASQLDALRDAVQIVPCPGDWTLGDCLNAGVHRATGTYVAKMDDDDHYGPDHLADLIAAMSFSEASVVGKLANPTHLTTLDVTVDWRIGDQERNVHHIPGATMLIRRELLKSYLFNRVSRGVDSSLWERMSHDGHKLYSTHWLNFIRVRHRKNTYVRPEEDFIDLASTTPAVGLDTDRWFA